MKGSHFELDRATVSLKPIQRPHPPIWLGANADAAVRRAARVADTWFINPHQRMDTIERQLSLYKQALADLGKPMPDELPLMREIFVARTRAGGGPAGAPVPRGEVQGLPAMGAAKGDAEGRRRPFTRL